VTEGKAHPGDAYFKEVARHLGEAYLRYSFTKGTAQEVPFIVEVLGLESGRRVLDVGCGPGRHAIELAKLGMQVTGVDVSAEFLRIAAKEARAAGVSASFFEVDARQMPFEDEFDAVISICQGGFGLMGKDDSLVLRRMTEAAKPGGKVLLTAFSSLFEASHPRPEATFDVDAGIVHERTTVRSDAGAELETDLWTGVYTPRELRLLALGVGLVPEDIWSVEPGDFARRKPDIEHPEFLMLASKPASRS
jgi:cyclopropane fatty-acyl-phospholipid synthase-like methyltransferase